MRSKALLLITTATAIRPTTRRAALGAVCIPTTAVAYDAATYDRYASSYDDLQLVHVVRRLWCTDREMLDLPPAIRQARHPA